MGILNQIKALAGVKKVKKPKKVKLKSVPKPKISKKPKTVKKKVISKSKSKPKKKTVTKKSKPLAKSKPKSQPKTKLKSKVMKKKAKIKKKILKQKIKAAKKTIKKKAKAVKKKVAKKPKKPVMEPPKKISKASAIKMIERDDASQFVHNVSGAEGLTVLSYLFKIGKEIDEFTLADKVKLQINFVRSLLYKLYEYKFVSFSRERDKKKGWFIYSWLAHPERLKEILLREKDKKVANLKLQAMDAQQIFYCASCNQNHSYVDAMEYMFFCSKCGTQLEAIETDKIKQKINQKIAQILKEKKELETI